MALDVLPEEEKVEPEPKEPEAKEPEAKEPEPKESEALLPTPEPLLPKARKKRGPPKEPKEQCPICLRYYSPKRVIPGGHANCIPPVANRTSPRVPTPPPEPEEAQDPMASSFIEPQISHADVVRFMARDRMNRHERKRERWQQQMFG